MATAVLDSPTSLATPHVLALQHAGRHNDGKCVMRFDVGQLSVEVRTAGDSLWLFIRRERRGGVALRAACLVGDFTCTKSPVQPGETGRLKVRSALGEYLVVIRAEGGALEHLRVTVSLTPAAPVAMPFMPRDLYPIDANDDPLGTHGIIEASQRGLNSGVLYFRIEEPAFGNVLYFQNLTAMNDYYRAVGTKPDGAVGGIWPELGYLLPTPPQVEVPPTSPLQAGVAVTLSDAILVFRHDAPPHERESARQFLQMLGEAYRMLEPPEVEYRDWIDRSERTLRDLDQAPEATISHYGHRYIHPYTAAEYPDVMVQTCVITAIHDWGKWCGEPHPLEAEFKGGAGEVLRPRAQVAAPLFAQCRRRQGRRRGRQLVSLPPDDRPGHARAGWGCRRAQAADEVDRLRHPGGTSFRL